MAGTMPRILPTLLQVKIGATPENDNEPDTFVSIGSLAAKIVCEAAARRRP